MKPKILLVDPRIQGLNPIELLLENLDTEIIIAKSGNEGLMQLLKHDYALAIVDVQMPEMDGFEMVSIMHENPKTRHIPVIFVSAINKDDFYIEKGIETGAVDLISKPIQPEILRCKVKVFLDLYLQKRELERINSELKSMNDKFENTTRKKKSFLSYMSHELKVLINTVEGYLKIIKENELKNKDLQLIQKDKLIRDLMEQKTKSNQPG